MILVNVKSVAVGIVSSDSAEARGNMARTGRFVWCPRTRMNNRCLPERDCASEADFMREFRLRACFHGIITSARQLPASSASSPVATRCASASVAAPIPIRSISILSGPTCSDSSHDPGAAPRPRVATHRRTDPRWVGPRLGSAAASLAPLASQRVANSSTTARNSGQSSRAPRCLQTLPGVAVPGHHHVTDPTAPTTRSGPLDAFQGHSHV